MPASQRRYPKPVRVGLADQVIEHLLQDISDGVYPPGAQLPPEGVLTEQTGVSRLTLREAINGLRQRGVVRVEQGRGTFVNPTAQWLPFDAMLLTSRVSRDTSLTLAIQLTEVRRIVEVGAAELAARRRTSADLAAMHDALRNMRNLVDQDDAVSFSRADVEFHLAVLRAGGNEFLARLLDPIEAALREVRTETSRSRQMNARALTMHTRIYEAIRDESPQAAATAMAQHLEETQDYIGSLVDQPS